MRKISVLLGLIAVAFPLLFVAASAPAQADHGSCWTNGYAPYPYPYPNGHGSRTDLPECRSMANGTRETYADLSLDLGLGGLKPNPAQNNRVKWPFVDSLGNVIYTVEKGASRWVVRAPDGTLLGIDKKLDRDQFILQGRGCMINDRLEATRTLMAFRFGQGGKEGVDYFLYNGATKGQLALRAFVANRAVDSAYWDDVQRVGTGCGGSGRPILNYATFSNPNFSGERFVGEDDKARSYRTYNAHYGGAIYVLARSTGLHGGGIVRAVVRAGHSTTVAIQDYYAYCDPNVPSGSRAVAGWWYGAIVHTRIFGYMPVHAC